MKTTRTERLAAMAEALAELKERAGRDRTKWDRAVSDDAAGLAEMIIYRTKLYLLDIPEDRYNLEKMALNGAESWEAYSWGGSANYIYNEDIALRYSTPSELKRTKNGARRPNGREEWLDVQARALGQAFRRLYMAYKAKLDVYIIRR